MSETPETFIRREELKPHLDPADVVWTRGGKLSAQGIRVGFLSSGERDGITVAGNSPRLNGELEMYEHAGHLEDYVRNSFDRAFAAVLQKRAIREERRRELADTSLAASFRLAWGELKDIVSERWGKVTSVMAGGSGQVQKNECEEGEN